MNAMQHAMAIIRDEHRAIHAVLHALLAHLEAVSEGRDKADFVLLHDLLDYIETIPDAVHHPKENEYLFSLLRLRTADANVILAELEGQHDTGVTMLASLRAALQSWRSDGNSNGFARSLQAYAGFLREHMRKEEEDLFPLAERHLTEEDWEAIHAAFLANRSQFW